MYTGSCVNITVHLLNFEIYFWNISISTFQNQISTYLWRYSSCGGCNCCNCYYNLQNKVRFKKINQLVYETTILNYLYVLLRREVMATTTSLTLWYLQTLHNRAFMCLCVFCLFLRFWYLILKCRYRNVPEIYFEIKQMNSDIYTWTGIK
jgi:hypothetical protein